MKGDAKMNKVKFAVLLLTALMVCTSCEDSFKVDNYLPVWQATENFNSYNLAEPIIVGETTVSFMTSSSSFNYDWEPNHYSSYSPRFCIKAGTESPTDLYAFFADARVEDFINAKTAINATYSYSSKYNLYITVNDLQPNTTYYYALFCDDGIGRLYGEVKSFTTKEPEPTPDFSTLVDLGLSVKWAKWNLGANKETEKGTTYTLSNVNKDIMNTKYDVAIQAWGQPWRMPSSQEAQELMDKCSWEFVTKDGVEGYKATGPNGGSVFFPCTNDTKTELWTGSWTTYSSRNCFYTFIIRLDDDDRIMKRILKNTDYWWYD
jgi:hypothetical protein